MLTRTTTFSSWTGRSIRRQQPWYCANADVWQELIKVQGLQVAPAELEALLLDHPDVQDVAVIGVTAYVYDPLYSRATNTHRG